jgi:hypothetical protein
MNKQDKINKISLKLFKTISETLSLQTEVNNYQKYINLILVSLIIIVYIIVLIN